MSKNPYHFRWHDDALRGYRNLSLEERGAYTTLLDLMYSDEEYIRENERILAAEMGVSTRKYRSLRDGLMKAGKIYYIAPGLISNRRFEEEISKREERRSSAQIRGKLGGRKKHENEKFRKEINAASLANSTSPYSEEKNNKNPATNNKGDSGTKRSSIDSLIDFEKRRKARGY